MSESTNEKVLTERRGHVLVITLNRPEVKNACDSGLARGMNAAMDLLDDTDDLFVGVITGAGGDFSAGADLKAAARGDLRERMPRGGFGLFKRPSRKPLLRIGSSIALQPFGCAPSFGAVPSPFLAARPAVRGRVWL